MHVVQGRVSTIHANCGNIIGKILSINENEEIGNIAFRCFAEYKYDFYTITCHWSVMPQLFVS